MNKPEYKLENWIFVDTGLTSIENWIFAAGRACGNVYGNPRFTDGERIITSPILEISESLDRIETMNSIYILGKKDGAA